MKKSLILMSFLVCFAAIDADPGPTLITRKGKAGVATPAYLRAIQLTANMTNDSDSVRLASKHGLDILNVTWEDTGRYKGSAVGPNISDMTIQVATRDPKTRNMTVRAMPVIRFPNFSDVTCDIAPEDFTLLVGNEKGRALKRVSLYDFLQNPGDYLARPSEWRGGPKSLLAPRDEQVLVSAQACFLPVPQKGIATFNPVLFNYQSMRNNPAVLTVLATRKGTSTTIIDNVRDPFEAGSVWGQRLFHNQAGMRASLTGERYSDAGISSSPSPGGDPDSIAGDNMVLLIQIPLVHPEPRRGEYDQAPMSASGGAAAPTKSKEQVSDVENAAIGFGAFEGRFTEIDHLAIKRDERYPVRVTVQFYKATSNGVVSDGDMREIRKQIDSVYKQSDSVGSLVTGGRTGRITEYDGPKVQPARWWDEFWQRYEQNQGMSREEGIRRLNEILGRDFVHKPVTRLYVCDLLRKKVKR